MKKSRSLLTAAMTLLVLLAVGALAGCGGDSSSESASASTAASSSADVVMAVSGDALLSQFAQAMSGAGLDGEGPYTVFAPTDDAVTATGASLDADAVKAASVEGDALTKDAIAAADKFDSMLPDNSIVSYTGSDGSMYVNDIKVVGGPITAGNGVVYIIDGVIVPD